MRTTDPRRVGVVVGVIQRSDGRYLIQQRLPGRPAGGQWEFPGGKIELAESPEIALARELREELGIIVEEVRGLMRHKQDYRHGNVLLHVFRICEYAGSVSGMEGQKIAWHDREKINRMNVLEAVRPILEKL